MEWGRTMWKWEMESGAMRQTSVSHPPFPLVCLVLGLVMCGVQVQGATLLEELQNNADFGPFYDLAIATAPQSVRDILAGTGGAGNATVLVPDSDAVDVFIEYWPGAKGQVAASLAGPHVFPGTYGRDFRNEANTRGEQADAEIAEADAEVAPTLFTASGDRVARSITLSTAEDPVSMMMMWKRTGKNAGSEDSLAFQLDQGGGRALSNNGWVETENGWIIPVKTVLLPSDLSAGGARVPAWDSSGGTSRSDALDATLAFLQREPHLGRFRDILADRGVLSATFLENLLVNSSSGATLLAPTDAAIDRLTPAARNVLSDPDQASVVRRWVRAHVLPGAWLDARCTSDDFPLRGLGAAGPWASADTATSVEGYCDVESDGPAPSLAGDAASTDDDDGVPTAASSQAERLFVRVHGSSGARRESLVVRTPGAAPTNLLPVGLTAPGVRIFPIDLALVPDGLESTFPTPSATTDAAAYDAAWAVLEHSKLRQWRQFQGWTRVFPEFAGKAPDSGIVTTAFGPTEIASLAISATVPAAWPLWAEMEVSAGAPPATGGSPATSGWQSTTADQIVRVHTTTGTRLESNDFEVRDVFGDGSALNSLLDRVLGVGRTIYAFRDGSSSGPKRVSAETGRNANLDTFNADIDAGAGVLQGLNGFLTIPPRIVAPTASMIDWIVQDPRATIFASWIPNLPTEVQAAIRGWAVSGSGVATTQPYTLFLPTDEAIRATLSPFQLAWLEEPEQSDILADVVATHIAIGPDPGIWTSRRIIRAARAAGGGVRLDNLEGTSLAIRICDEEGRVPSPLPDPDAFASAPLRVSAGLTALENFPKSPQPAASAMNQDKKDAASIPVGSVHDGLGDDRDADDFNAGRDFSSRSGIYHVVDRLLLSAAVLRAIPTRSTTLAEDGLNLVPRFRGLVSKVPRLLAAFDDAILDSGTSNHRSAAPFTVFAPTDAALNALDDAIPAWEMHLTTPTNLPLARFLEAHVAPETMWTWESLPTTSSDNPMTTSTALQPLQVRTEYGGNSGSVTIRLQGPVFDDPNAPSGSAQTVRGKRVTFATSSMRQKKVDNGVVLQIPDILRHPSLDALLPTLSLRETIIQLAQSGSGRVAAAVGELLNRTTIANRLAPLLDNPPSSTNCWKLMHVGRPTERRVHAGHDALSPCYSTVLVPTETAFRSLSYAQQNFLLDKSTDQEVVDRQVDWLARMVAPGAILHDDSVLSRGGLRAAGRSSTIYLNTSIAGTPCTTTPADSDFILSHSCTWSIDGMDETGRVRIGGAGIVGDGPIRAANGIIHSIDSVWRPTNASTREWPQTPSLPSTSLYAALLAPGLGVADAASLTLVPPPTPSNTTPPSNASYPDSLPIPSWWRNDSNSYFSISRVLLSEAPLDVGLAMADNIVPGEANEPLTWALPTDEGWVRATRYGILPSTAPIPFSSLMSWAGASSPLTRLVGGGKSMYLSSQVAPACRNGDPERSRVLWLFLAGRGGSKTSEDIAAKELRLQTAAGNDARDSDDQPAPRTVWSTESLRRLRARVRARLLKGGGGDDEGLSMVGGGRYLAEEEWIVRSSDREQEEIMLMPLDQPWDALATEGARSGIVHGANSIVPSPALLAEFPMRNVIDSLDKIGASTFAKMLRAAEKMWGPKVGSMLLGAASGNASIAWLNQTSVGGGASVEAATNPTMFGGVTVFAPLDSYLEESDDAAFIVEELVGDEANAQYLLATLANHVIAGGAVFDGDSLRTPTRTADISVPTADPAFLVTNWTGFTPGYEVTKTKPGASMSRSKSVSKEVHGVSIIVRPGSGSARAVFVTPTGDPGAPSSMVEADSAILTTGGVILPIIGLLVPPEVRRRLPSQPSTIWSDIVEPFPDRFSTLLSLAPLVGLNATLRTPRFRGEAEWQGSSVALPLTLLAPTNDAIDAAARDLEFPALGAWLAAARNRDALQTVLGAHVLPGTIWSDETVDTPPYANLSDSRAFRTLSRGGERASVAERTVKLLRGCVSTAPTGGRCIPSSSQQSSSSTVVEVATATLPGEAETAGNGVAWEVSTLLLPPGLAVPTQPLRQVLGMDESAKAFTWLVEQKCSDSLRSQLESGAQTVLVPTDGAFAKLPESWLGPLLFNITESQADSLVKAHMLPDTFAFYEDLIAAGNDGEQWDSALGGSSVRFSTASLPKSGDSGSITYPWPTKSVRATVASVQGVVLPIGLDGSLRGGGPDRATASGVLHAVSTVLIPSTLRASLPTITVANAVDGVLDNDARSGGGLDLFRGLLALTERPSLALIRHKNDDPNALVPSSVGQGSSPSTVAASFADFSILAPKDSGWGALAKKGSSTLPSPNPFPALLPFLVSRGGRNIESAIASHAWSEMSSPYTITGGFSGTFGPQDTLLTSLHPELQKQGSSTQVGKASTGIQMAMVGGSFGSGGVAKIGWRGLSVQELPAEVDEDNANANPGGAATTSGNVQPITEPLLPPASALGRNPFFAVPLRSALDTLDTIAAATRAAAASGAPARADRALSVTTALIQTHVSAAVRRLISRSTGTLLIPSDAAWSKMPAYHVAWLLKPESKYALDLIIRAHFLPDHYASLSALSLSPTAIRPNAFPDAPSVEFAQSSGDDKVVIVGWEGRTSSHDPNGHSTAKVLAVNTKDDRALVPTWAEEAGAGGIVEGYRRGVPGSDLVTRSHMMHIIDTVLIPDGILDLLPTSGKVSNVLDDILLARASIPEGATGASAAIPTCGNFSRWVAEDETLADVFRRPAPAKQSNGANVQTSLAHLTVFVPTDEAVKRLENQFPAVHLWLKARSGANLRELVEAHTVRSTRATATAMKQAVERDGASVGAKHVVSAPNATVISAGAASSLYGGETPILGLLRAEEGLQAWPARQSDVGYARASTVLVVASADTSSVKPTAPFGQDAWEKDVNSIGFSSFSAAAMVARAAERAWESAEEEAAAAIPPYIPPSNSSNGTTPTFTSNYSSLWPDAAGVVESDLEAENGVVHFIDAVLSSNRRAPPKWNLVESLSKVSAEVSLERQAVMDGVWGNSTASHDMHHDSRWQALSRRPSVAPTLFPRLQHPATRHSYVSFGKLVAAASPALQQYLMSRGVTVFAPTDAAFASLTEPLRKSLLEPSAAEFDRERADAVLSQSILPNTYLYTPELRTAGNGPWKSAGSAADVTARTLPAWPLWTEIRPQGSDSRYLGSSALIVDPDLETTTGIVHGIDSILVPPSMAAVVDAANRLPNADVVSGVVHPDSGFTVYRALLSAAPRAAITLTKSNSAGYSNNIATPTPPYSLLAPGNLDARRLLTLTTPALLRMLSALPLRPNLANSPSSSINSTISRALYSALDAFVLGQAVNGTLVTAPFPTNRRARVLAVPYVATEENTQEVVWMENQFGFDVIAAEQGQLDSGDAMDISSGPDYPVDGNNDEDKQGLLYETRGVLVTTETWKQLTVAMFDTVLDAVKADPKLTTLSTLLDAATPQLREILKGGAPAASGSNPSASGAGFSATLIAPDDKAWQAIPPTQRASMLSGASGSLDRLLRALIIPDSYILPNNIPAAVPPSQDDPTNPTSSFTQLDPFDHRGRVLPNLLASSEGAAPSRFERWMTPGSDSDDGEFLINGAKVTGKNQTLSGVVLRTSAITIPAAVQTSLTAAAPLARVLLARDADQLPAPDAVKGETPSSIADAGEPWLSFASVSPASLALAQSVPPDGWLYNPDLASLLGAPEVETSTSTNPSSTASSNAVPATLFLSHPDEIKDVIAKSPALPWILRGRSVQDWAADAASITVGPGSDADGPAFSPRGTLLPHTGRSSAVWFDPEVEFDRLPPSGEDDDSSAVSALTAANDAWTVIEELGSDLLSLTLGRWSVRGLAFQSWIRKRSKDGVMVHSLASYTAETSLDMDNGGDKAVEALSLWVGKDGSAKAGIAVGPWDWESKDGGVIRAVQVNSADLVADAGVVHLLNKDKPGTDNPATDSFAGILLPSLATAPVTPAWGVVEAGLPPGAGSSSVFREMMKAVADDDVAMLAPLSSKTAPMTPMGTTLLVPVDAAVAALDPARVAVLLDTDSTVAASLALAHSVLPTLGSRFTDGLLRAASEALRGDVSGSTDPASALAGGLDLPIAGIPTAAAIVAGTSGPRLNFSRISSPALSLAGSTFDSATSGGGGDDDGSGMADSSAWGATASAAEKNPLRLTTGLLGSHALRILTIPPNDVGSEEMSWLDRSAAQVLGGDTQAADAIVHWIDHVLIPDEVIGTLPQDACEAPFDASTLNGTAPELHKCGDAEDGGPRGICLAGACVCGAGLGGDGCVSTSQDSCANGKKDGSETGVDCGGKCGPCPEGQRCDASKSNVCLAGFECTNVVGSGPRCVRGGFTRAGPYVDVTVDWKGLPIRAVVGIPSAQSRAQKEAAKVMGLEEDAPAAINQAWRYAAKGAQAARSNGELKTTTDAMAQSALQAALVTNTAIRRTLTEAVGVAWAAGEYDGRPLGCGIQDGIPGAAAPNLECSWDRRHMSGFRPPSWYTNVLLLDVSDETDSNDEDVVPITRTRARIFLPSGSIVGARATDTEIGNAGEAAAKANTDAGHLIKVAQWVIPAFASPAGMGAPPGPQNPTRALYSLPESLQASPPTLRSISIEEDWKAGKSGGDAAPSPSPSVSAKPSPNNTPDSGGAAAAVVVSLFLLIVFGVVVYLYRSGGGSWQRFRQNPEDLPRRVSKRLRSVLEGANREAVSKPPVITGALVEMSDVPGTSESNPIYERGETSDEDSPGRDSGSGDEEGGGAKRVINPLGAAAGEGHHTTGPLPADTAPPISTGPAILSDGGGSTGEGDGAGDVVVNPLQVSSRGLLDGE